MKKRPIRNNTASVEECEENKLAAKREIAASLLKTMKRQKVSQSELARRMRTSRAVVHRLLRGDDPSVTLATISRAADALGRSVAFHLKGRSA